MIKGSSLAVRFCLGTLFSFFLVLTSSKTSFSQNAQSELLGINGDGLSLQAAQVNNQLSYAHINQLTGQLKFATLTLAGWTEQVIGSGFSATSNLSLSVSPSGAAQLAVVNGSSGALSFYSRSTNGTWSTELVQPGNVRGKPSLYVGANETLISFSSSSTQNLMLAKKTTTNWVVTTVDGSADAVGKESSVGVGSNSYVAIAYSDETNLKLKVATSLDRINWAIETIDYPSAKFGRLPQLTWTSNSDLSIMTGDVIQDSTVGGQGIYHLQRSIAGQWSFEEIGFPAESSQVGKFVGVADNKNSAIITRARGISSILNTQRSTNGLWTGVTGFIAPVGESLSDIATATDAAGVLNYFSRATIGSQTFVRRANGIVVVSAPPSDPVPPTVEPTPDPVPEPVPEPVPVPEPRSGIDSDGDGLSDADETDRGTNPLVIDTDGDGMSDGQEVADQTNPNSANSFHGSIENKICSFWYRKNGISNRLSVSNSIASALTYNIEISSFAGQLKGVDEITITQKTSSIISLDQLIKSSGNLTRGQVCISYSGGKNFITAQYIEANTSEPLKRKSGTKKAPAYLLEHALTAGEGGNQVLSFKAISSARNERIISELNLQNTSARVVKGKITGYDSRGRKTVTASVSINPGSLIIIAPAKLKLSSTGRIIWNPSVSTAVVRAVYEQELERKVGKEYSAVKISRKDGSKK